MFAQGKITTDRNVIKMWVNARGGWPAIIRKFTSAGVEMALSIVFPGSETDETIHRLTWEEFFEKFEQQHLVFIYEDKDNYHQLSLSFAFV
ncbi:MAG: hypothetical protein EHM70_08600 [Chloroflexota bacterium]|nr:MAG: hypothetical protein EHM70_08600 [Chloroflexota bacterium]